MDLRGIQPGPQAVRIRGSNVLFYLANPLAGPVRRQSCETT